MTARINGKIAGVVQLTINRQEENGKLSKLFVHPDYLHQGIGSALYQWAVSSARTQCISALLVDADPNAEAFYIRQGGYPHRGNAVGIPAPAGFSRCY
ncbi:Predicted acetyltransferase [Morganella morganii]|nr:Predicted acetyltransferase [Morganella morganii]